MSRYGRTIRIYLPDGSPNGLKHAELVNWTGQALMCPRGRVGELLKWPESQRPGVYFLFGEHDDGTPLAYIGEAEDVFVRLQSHIKNKGFWSQVVLFTSKDENLTKSHVKYLESRLIEMAQAADRIALENRNNPKRPSLPRSDRDSMEEFLELAQILLMALGFSLLQLVSKNMVQADYESDLLSSDGPLSNITLSFFVSKRNVNAKGISTDEGFVVLAGSLGSLELKDSLSPALRELRDTLIAQKQIEVYGDQIRFLKDVLFKSPSAAAGVVSGGVWNGRVAWKDENGKSLKELEEALLDALTGS